MTTTFETRTAANAAIVADKGVPGVTHYAQGNRKNGVDYYVIVACAAPVIEKGAPVRSERYVYTASGKKRTSRELCGRVFKRFANDRKAFVAAATELGVKAATANAMFSHYASGRYAAV